MKVVVLLPAGNEPAGLDRSDILMSNSRALASQLLTVIFLFVSGSELSLTTRLWHCIGLGLRSLMKHSQETIRLRSLGDQLVGTLFLPDTEKRSSVLIICHGAGEFKENYFELCELLADRGVATLAIDMHGHGESDGERYYVSMRQWVADVQAAIDFLLTHPRIDGGRIGAFGLSSGGTAILEAALVDPRLKRWSRWMPRSGIPCHSP